MKDEEIKEISEDLARKIERLVSAGIKDRTILAVEIKYALKEYLDGKAENNKYWEDE
jgi:hypothetical protein